jgi:hypothetical protein
MSNTALEQALQELANLESELDAFTAKPNKDKSVSFFYAHGWAFFFAWNVFVLVQIATARYMRHKWETNMILHTASGMLITMITMFWGFWAISKNGFNPGMGNYIGQTGKGGQVAYQHSFAGIIVALMGVPLMLTGFIAYFRRWQAGSNATLLMRLRDIHKVRKQCPLTLCSTCPGSLFLLRSTESQVASTATTAHAFSTHTSGLQAP